MSEIPPQSFRDLSAASRRPIMPPGFPSVAGAALMWGALGILYRYLTDVAGMSPAAVAFVRAAGGGALLAAWLAFNRPHALSAGWKDLLYIAGSALGSVTILYILFIESVRRTEIANAAVLLYTAPAWIALISWILFGERLSGRRAGGVVLAAAGVVVMIVLSGAPAGPVSTGAPETPDAPFGDFETLSRVSRGEGVARAGVLYGLAAGLAWAASALYGSWKLRGYPQTTVATWSLLIGAVLLLPFQAPGSIAPVYGSSIAFAAALLLAAGPTAAGTLMYLRGVARMDPASAGLITLIEPLAAAVLAWVLLKELPAPAGLAGGALILTGAFLLMMKERKPPEVRYIN